MGKDIQGTPYQTVELVKALAEVRRKKGLTQKALATRLGIPQSHVSNIERGKLDLRLSTLIDLARQLDLELLLVPKKYVPAMRSMTAGAPSWAEESDNYLYRLPTPSEQT